MFHSLKSQRTLDNSTSIVQLAVINKNILYVTHRIDSLYKLVQEIKHDMDLRNQVDEYYAPGTSPQTDTGEQT